MTSWYKFPAPPQSPSLQATENWGRTWDRGYTVNLIRSAVPLISLVGRHSSLCAQQPSKTCWQRSSAPSGFSCLPLDSSYLTRGFHLPFSASSTSLGASICLSRLLPPLLGFHLPLSLPFPLMIVSSPDPTYEREGLVTSGCHQTLSARVGSGDETN